jgi:demethylmenaquinone methyltransferase/2-methoxy-6-polyprenyl-1,4-benzoquinol methylase
MSHLQQRDTTDIQNIFSRIADRYDFANDLLSFGIHRIWKSRFVDALELSPGSRVLDCATGTGDIALRCAGRLGESSTIFGVDLNPEMLAEARRKSKTKDLKPSLRWEVQNILDMDFPSNIFDVVTIAYGIRNVADPKAALEEMARVTSPGGRIHILEFGQPDGVFGSLYDLYSRYVIPTVGQIIAGSEEPYQHLDESSRAFPCGSEFVQLLTEVERVTDIRSTRLTLGISWMYNAQILPPQVRLP